MPKYQGERNHYLLPEAVTQRFSGKKVFLKMALNSQENNCARVSLLINMQISASNSGGCFLATDDFLDFNDFLTASYFKHPSFNIKLQYHTFNTYMEETNRRGSVYCQYPSCFQHLLPAKCQHIHDKDCLECQASSILARLMSFIKR